MEHFDQVLKFLTATDEEKDYSSTCIYRNYDQPHLNCAHCEGYRPFCVKQKSRMEEIERSFDR